MSEQDRGGPQPGADPTAPVPPEGWAAPPPPPPYTGPAYPPPQVYPGYGTPAGSAYGPPYPPPDQPYATGAGGAYPPPPAPGYAGGYPPPAPPSWSQVQGPGTYAAPIPTYLAAAILSTLFCCLPLGIVSIVYAAQVSSKQQAGDIAGALDASRRARTWAWVSFGVGLAAIAGWTLVVVIAGIATHSSSGG